MAATTIAPGAGTGAAYRYRFVVLGVVWFAYNIVFLSRLAVGPLSPFLKDSLRLSSAQVGGLTSATAIAYAPTLVIAGLLVDRVGVRRTLAAGTFIAGVCVALLFFATSYGMVFALLALSGLGCGCIYPSAVKAVMVWFPPRERATAIGFNQAAINVGGIVGGAVLPSVAVALSWQYAFLFVGLTALVICAVCAILYRNPPETEYRLLSESLVGTAAATCRVRPSRRDTLGVVRQRDMIPLSLGGFFLGIVEFSALAHLVLYLKDSLAIAAVAAGGLLALCQAAGAVAKPTSGLVSDRLLCGRRRPTLVVMGVATAAASLALAGISPGNRWLIYPCLVVFGAGAIGWGGLFGTLAGEIGGHANAGFAAGLAAAIVNLGIVVGPPLFGVLVDTTGSYTLSWVAMAASGMAAAISFFFIREPAAAMRDLAEEIEPGV